MDVTKERLGQQIMAKGLLLVLLAVVAVEKASAIPSSSFYTYGPGAGDSSLPANDDGSTSFTLSQAFVFFGDSYTLIYVNNNGDITFNSPLSSYTSSPFPLPNVPIIAPYWADVDTRCGGGPVYYRETTDSSILSKAVNEIPFASTNGFSPTHVTIVTWPGVGYYNCHIDKVNTFQAVLVTDGTSSYVIFNYLDNGITWTTGDASGGSNGVGGTPAQVGFNKGDATNYFSASLSRTADVENIETTSNVDVPGRYVWQVNGVIITPAPQCPALTVSNTGGGLTVINPSPAFSGAVATYSCGTGYSLVGNSQRTCQSNLAWSGSEPYCEAVNCGSLNTCCGLAVSTTGTTFNHVATYSCTNTGYQLIGSSTRTCTSGGYWSGSEPYCQIVSCGGLSASNPLIVSTTGTTYGSTATYSCAAGYVLVGSSSRTCQATGAWSGSVPYCTLVSCGSLTTSGTGGLSGSLTGTTYGSTATYSCTQVGYELVGTATLMCQSNGVWSGSVPYCTLVNCGDLSISGTGDPVVSYPATTYGSTATYSCSLTGYELIGSSTRVCQSSGGWSGSTPYCQIVSCGSLSISGAGGITVSTTGTVYNSVATYTCTQVGYELIGASQRTCQADAAWSNSAPHCQLVDCGSLSASGTGGLSVDVPGTTYSQVATYSCTVVGYELVGASQRTCQDNGAWSGSEPFCRLIDCGAPDLPSDTTALIVSYTTTTYASIVTYNCEIGYNFFGVQSRTCLETYSWSGNPPHCEIVDCGPLTTDSNALGSLAVSFTTTVYLSTAVYTCPDVGYVLIGSDTRICRETGAWVDDPPHCDIVPLNFAGHVISATAIYLNWDLPPNPSDVEDLVEHYTVTVTNLETGQEVSFLTLTKSTTIQFLHPNYNYICKVAVITDHINPDSNTLSFLTFQAAPSSAPLNPSHQVINSQSFSLSWHPPLTEDQNGDIQYYLIQLTEVDTNVTSQLSSTSTSITLPGLHPYYTYVYSISAFTVDEGPYTSENSLTLPEAAPTAPPVNPSGSSVDSRSIIITWSPPPLEGQNGIIREYRILIVELETVSTFMSVSYSLSATITSLHPNYNYECSITAVTVALGPYTQTFIVTTPEDRPETAPSNFEAVATSPYAANLTWDSLPTTEQNGVITGYIINITVTETGEKLQLTSTSTYLTVNTLRPFRSYVCIIAAQTSIGIGPFSGEFTLQTPQDAPSGPPLSLTSSAITSVSFVLLWDLPDYYHQNGIITHYEILVTVAQTSEIFTTTSFGTSLTLQSLHPAYNYECKVAAVTVAGTGPFTISFDVGTLEDVPSGTPQQFDAIDVLSRSITFSWDPPLFEEQNGVIVHYELDVTALATFIVQSYTTTSTTFTITNLIPFSHYTYVIAAATAIGLGPYTETATIITPEDAPNTAPTLTTAYAADSRTVALQWTPPPPEDHNGIIREYRVNVTSLNNGDHMQVAAPNTTTIIGSLTPSFTYNFTVTAFTVAEGPYSQVQTITMPPDVPTGSPQDVVAVSNTYDSITLSWNSPLLEEQNGDIVYYVVNVTHTVTLQRFQYTVSAPTITVSDLDPYTNYVCVVAAATASGVGPFSTLVHVRTLEAVPGSHPQNPTAVSPSPTSILITWDAPDDPNGEIDGYRIYVTEAETGQVIMQLSPVTQITIDGLHPFYTYNCLIVAFTVGDGPNVTVSVVTQEDAPSSPPQAFTTAVVDSTSIFTSWNPPPQETQNGIIRAYTVLVENAATGEVLSFSTQNTSITISGLRPYTSYNCRVAMVTVATGPFSPNINVTTLQDVPSGQPMMLNSTSLTSEQLLLSWLPPAPDATNGIIQNYILRVTEIETATVSLYTTPDTTYLLLDLHPYYTYVCSISAVTIGAGPETTIIVQMPEDLPATAPGNFLVVSISSSSLVFTWDPIPVEHQNGIIRHYSIAITEQDTGTSLLKTSTVESITLNNLHPFYTYSVQVSASTIDDGPPSPPVLVTTSEDVPSSPPTDFEVNIVNSTAIELSWQPPAVTNRNGIITSYSVRVVKPGSGEIIVDQTISGMNFIISSNLLPHTTYACSVLASTSIGMGPATTLVITTPQDVPSGAPLGLSGSVISSTAILLTWSPPLADTHNGIIVLYTVLVMEINTNTVSHHNTTETSLALTSLHPYYQYECSVAAVTVRSGPYSAVFSLTTNQDAPSAPPSAVAVTATDSSSITITWNPPPADAINGIITYFAVNVTVQNTNERSHYQVTETELTIDDLHPYYTFTVVVAAFTIAKGPFSAEFSITTPQDAPSSPPRNFESVEESSDSIILSWLPPLISDQNGMIQYYALRILETNTNTTIEEQQNFTQNSITIDSLHPYYSYQISIAAFTVALGPSTTITVQTKESAPSAGPKNLIHSFSNSSSVSLQWDSPDPDETNGLIVHYIISVFNIETLSTTEHTSQVTSITLNNLHPYYNYSCNIAAVTVAVGVATNIVFRMPEDVPTNSPDMLHTPILTSTKVQLVWHAIPAAEQNGLITNYVVIVYDERSEQETTYTTTDASLTISSLSPFTTHQCKVAASTSVGLGPYTTELVFATEEDAPSAPPTNIEAVSVSSSAVTVTWSPPPVNSQNGIIRNYTVYVLETETGVVTTLNTTTTSVARSSLHPYYLYQFFVAAVTVGIGPLGYVNVQTLQDAPTSSPIGVANSSISSSSIQLVWNPPSDDQINGIIHHYIIKVQVAGSQEQTEYETSSLQFTLTELPPYCTHIIQVAAFTNALGPFSTPLTIVTLEDAPSDSPQNIVPDQITSTTIQLSWEPPLPQHQNGVIDSYTVVVLEVATNFQVQTHQDVTSTSITLVDLHPAYLYTLSVAAMTVDLGPVSYIMVTTKEASPSQGPRNLEVNLITSSSIAVQWNPPDVDQSNGVIRYYSIELLGQTNGDIRVFTTPRTNHNISNLHPYYNYSLSVAAVTVSEGVRSTYDFQMSEDVPNSAPQNVSVVTVNSSAIRVTWEAPAFEEQNGLIRLYVLLINETETETQISITVVDNQKTVSDLHPVYNYQVQVAANTVGIGPFSMPTSWQLPEGSPSVPPGGLSYELGIDTSTAVISWNHLPEDQQNGDILGYAVSCTSQEGHQLSENETGTSITVIGLVQNSHYTCTVCAFTAVGCGPSAITYISTFDEMSPFGPAKFVNVIPTTTTVYLEWEAPYDPQALITGFSVVYQIVNTSAPILVPRNPQIISPININVSILIENLLQDSVYTIQVFPQTEMGNGIGSDVITVQTLAPALEAPSNFQCSATSSTALMCSWEPPFAPNYIVLDYDITYRLADGYDFYSEYGENVEIYGLLGGLRMLPLSGLRPYAGYIVELTSNLIFLDLGSGGSGDNNTENGSESEEIVQRRTSVISFTWEEEPEASTPFESFDLKVESPTQVELTWVPPPRMTWRGVIQYYILTVTRIAPVESGGRVNTNDHTYLQETTVNVVPMSNHHDPSLASDPLMTELYMKGDLEENFQYSFTLALVNSAGTGPSSAALVQNMPEAVPSGPPTNISVASSSESSITVSWLPPNPLEANGIITNYTLEYFRVDSSDLLKVNLSAEQTSFTKTGLRPSENISVRLAASTISGLGPFSDEVFVSNKPAVPSEPRELTASIPRETSQILLTWLAPNNPNGELIGYFIVYKATTRDESLVRINPVGVPIRASEELRYLLTDVAPDLFYFFNVSAWNEAGYGRNASTVIYTGPAPVTEGVSEEPATEVNIVLIILCVVLSLATLSICVLLVVIVIVTVLSKRVKNKYKYSKFTRSSPHEGLVNPTSEGLVVENALYEESLSKEKGQLSFQDDSDKNDKTTMKNQGAEEFEANQKDDEASSLGDGWL